MSVGYTEKQAEALRRKVDRAVARAEDALAALQGLVSDTSVNVWGLQEDVRAIGHDLEHTINRRTRS